jgi:hypothetical protein
MGVVMEFNKLSKIAFVVDDKTVSQYQQLKKSFFDKYKKLEELNKDACEDFDLLKEELQEKSPRSFLEFYNLSDIRDDIASMTEAVDMEILNLEINDSYIGDGVNSSSYYQNGSCWTYG